MAEPLTIPPPDEIRIQIEARRQEIAELKKLLKVSAVAAKAKEAHERQRPVAQLSGGVVRAS
jgi:hypothetical protein